MIELIVISFALAVALLTVRFGRKHGGWADKPSRPITPTPGSLIKLEHAKPMTFPQIMEALKEKTETPKKTPRDPRRRKQPKPQKVQKADKRRNKPQ